MFGKFTQMLARKMRLKPEPEPKRKVPPDVAALQQKNWTQEQRLRILEKRAQLHQ